MIAPFIAFKVEQAQIRKAIKHQIKAGIPESELHYFCLSQKDYQQLDWVREDIEFRVGTNMYDIVRSENENDSISLYCVNDKEEAVLFAELDDVVKKQMEGDANSPSGKGSKTLNLVYIVPNFHFSLVVCSFFDPANFSEINKFYAEPVIECIPHPPDLV